MSEFHASFSTRSWSTFVVMVMALSGLALGLWWIRGGIVLPGVAAITVCLMCAISASVYWSKAIISELHIYNDSIVFSDVENGGTVLRSDVARIVYDDQSDIPEIFLVLRNGQEIRIPPNSFRVTKPAIDCLRKNWQEIEVTTIYKAEGK